MRKLTDNEQQAYDNFRGLFSKANPDTEIKFVSAKREKDYLRVTVLRNGAEDWYHVIDGGRTWY